MSSCSIHPSNYTLSNRHTLDSVPNLQRINIRSFWSNPYTGLLAFDSSSTGFHYALLDSSGIKLLEATITGSGEQIILNGVEKIKRSGLPEVLAATLQRVYLIEPLSTGCPDTNWNAVCQKILDDGSRIKYHRNGPLTRWRVVESDKSDVITYSQPWTGFTLTLSAIK